MTRLKLLLCYVLTFIILFISLSIASSNDEECENWNNYCKIADESNNKYFRCFTKAIFFYEKSILDWDSSRQMCSQKFDGSHQADLVKLSHDHKDEATEMLQGVFESGTADQEIGTSGVCCMQKIDSTTSETVCQWLSDGTNVNAQDEKDGNKCRALFIKFDDNHFSQEFSKAEPAPPLQSPYLCAYNIPDHCERETHITESPLRSTTSKGDKTNPVTMTDNTDTSTGSTPIYQNNTDIDEHLDHIIDRLNNDSIDSTELLDCSDKLKDLINKQDLTSPTSLNTTLIIIDKLQTIYKDLQDKMQLKILYNFTRNIIQTCDKLLECDKAWKSINDKYEQTKFSSKILQFTQISGFIYGCKHETNMDELRVHESNIAVRTIPMKYNETTNFTIDGMDSSITVPAGVPRPDKFTTCSRDTAVGSIFDKLSQYLINHVKNDQEVNSKIVSFSYINELNTTKLPDNLPPVKIIVRHNQLLKFGDKVDCVYWDFNAMEWSAKGCRYVPNESNRKLSFCECNHLTNFAALMDVSGRETNTKVKDILTKVCSGLSIICLILTIGFLTICRVLRNRRNNITTNLCVCLLVVNILVVFGMDLIQYDALCQTVSGLLLYALLSSFSWQLMEGYHLYQMIVLVFSNVGHLRLIYLYGIGYGAPALITLSALLAMGFKSVSEDEAYFCWISSPSQPYRIWAVAGPALVVLMANGLIMYLALKEAFSAKFKKRQISDNELTSTSNTDSIVDKLSKSFSWMKGFVSLVALLGITWISFLLYIHEYGQCFSYIFIVLNGLQGVFIFTFTILLNDKARTVIRKSYHARHPSRYFSSLYKTNSTNAFTSMRSKSLSKDKSSNDNLKNLNSVSKITGNASDERSASIDSHRSQTISMHRIRNASDSILF